MSMRPLRLVAKGINRYRFARCSVLTHESKRTVGLRSRTSPRTSRLQQFPKPRLNGGFDLVRPRIPGIIPIGNAKMTGNAVPFCSRPSLE